MTQNGHRSAGFTLLETLIALAVFTGLLIWFSTGITRSWRGVSAAEADKRALALAQALLEETGVTSPLTPGTREGTAPNGIAWRVVVTPYRASDGSAEAPADAAKACWVTVTAAPRSATGSARRPLTLTTLKLTRGS